MESERLQATLLSETDVKLKLNGRIHAANVSINGINLGACTFDGEIDISSVAKIGENEVAIELYTSARNKLALITISFGKKT